MDNLTLGMIIPASGKTSEYFCGTPDISGAIKEMLELMRKMIESQERMIAIIDRNFNGQR